MNPHSVDILLVEDSTDDAELTIWELKRHHMSNNLVHVMESEEALGLLFATGKYAARRYNYSLPKIILLDIQMPKVNGIEVLKNVKSDERTKAIPVTILTSSNQHPGIRATYNAYFMKKISVLIVDDHKLIRETWQTLLGTVENIDIIGLCGDGQTAIDIAGRLKPDTVLLDMNMLPLSGTEILKMIRNRSPLSKIIVVSMRSEPAFVRQLLRLGAKGYVTKSSPRDELLYAIDEVSKGNIFICKEVRDNLDKDIIKSDGDVPDINCLSERELQVLALLSAAKSSRDIAAELTIALKTVEVHRHNILKKMKVRNITSLIRYINTHEADW